MKRIVMTMLLSLMVMSVSSFTYQTEYNYQRSTFGTTSNYIPHNNTQSIEYRRIGYTTNYSNGQFNSAQYYQDTYTPTSIGSIGKHGQPRRVKGYDDNGNEINTDGQGNPSDPSKGMWKDGYEYYYEPSTGYWYRTKDGGETWQKWSSWLDWGGLFWDWRGGRPHGGNVTHYNEQNPVPIGDNYIWFMVCIVSIYSLIKSKRNKLKHSAY